MDNQDKKRKNTTLELDEDYADYSFLKEQAKSEEVSSFSSFSKYGTFSEETIEESSILRKEKRKQKKQKEEKEKKKDKKEKKDTNFYREMASTIEGYGFSYSLSNFLRTAGIFMTSTCVIGYMLKMRIAYIAVLILFELFLMVPLIKSQYKFLYEERKFDQLISYMKQMAYSFKKEPKISVALEDTSQVVTGKMKELVDKAINSLNTSNSAYLYEEALDIIFDEYSCNRLGQLHDFLIKIEERGGEYQNSMNVLIDDIVNWAERTYTFQAQRSVIKRDILISLCLSMLICSSTIFMMPAQTSFTNEPLYQISTLVCLCIFLSIYTLSQSMLNGSWLENDIAKNPEKIRKDYLISSGKKKVIAKKSDKIAAILALIFCLFYGFFVKQYVWIFAGILVFYLIWTRPERILKNALKNTKREIEKEIPGWCREIALNLQTENVFQSIVLTESTCPAVLEEPVHELILKIQNNPGDVIAFNEFLKEYHISEVGQMMNTLYSISETGTMDVDSQINKIIASNNKLVHKSEELKNEDANAGAGILTLVPMVIGSLKMLVDLSLLITSFINLTQLTGL